MADARIDGWAIVGLLCGVSLIAGGLLIEPFVLAEDVGFVGTVRVVPRNPGLIFGTLLLVLCGRRLYR